MVKFRYYIFYKKNWEVLCKNSKTIHLLEQNQDKIDWSTTNLTILDFYKILSERCAIYKEELIAAAMHP